MADRRAAPLTSRQIEKRLPRHLKYGSYKVNILSEVVKSQTCSTSGGKPAVSFANEPTFINKIPFTAAKLADESESGRAAE